MEAGMWLRAMKLSEQDMIEVHTEIKCYSS
jgi:hypothetical protein